MYEYKKLSNVFFMKTRSNSSNKAAKQMVETKTGVKIKL